MWGRERAHAMGMTEWEYQCQLWEELDQQRQLAHKKNPERDFDKYMALKEIFSNTNKLVLRNAGIEARNILESWIFYTVGETSRVKTTRKGAIAELKLNIETVRNLCDWLEDAINQQGKLHIVGRPSGKQGKNG